MLRYETKGPVSAHMGDELSLMLGGAKPLAVFAQEAGMSRSAVVPAGFDAAVKQRRLVAMTVEMLKPGYASHYFALPDEAWRLRIMRSYGELGAMSPGGGDLAFSRLEHQLFLGYMLGYAEEDTHAFVGRNALRMHGEGMLSAEDMAPYIAPLASTTGRRIAVGNVDSVGQIGGRIVLRTGQSMALSVSPGEQWRAKAVASALDGVAVWKGDAASRADVVRLLEFLIQPDGDEVEILIAWAEQTVP
ncbi:hypothetical protein KPL74_21345 [Bacillus sp. NP157]|nr:hypothetical protein KPL74_21345 [Bacillus sp. NP157]